MTIQSSSSRPDLVSSVSVYDKPSDAELAHDVRAAVAFLVKALNAASNAGIQVQNMTGFAFLLTRGEDNYWSPPVYKLIREL